MKKYIADVFTGCRILCSILLLRFPVFSVPFSIVYLFCGLSDMVDGTIARKTHSSSAFGARFDTLADLIFAAVCLVKFLPSISIPGWLWVWIAVIAILKTGNIIWGFIHKKQFIALHTVLNKTTGALLFLLPLTLQFIELKYSAAVVCAVATVAAIQEGYYIGTDREIVSFNQFKSIHEKTDL